MNKHHPPRAQWLQAGGSLNTKEIACFLQEDTYFRNRRVYFKVLSAGASHATQVVRDWYLERGFPSLQWKTYKLDSNPITAGLVRDMLDDKAESLRLDALSLSEKETVESYSYLNRYREVEQIMERWYSNQEIFYTGTPFWGKQADPLYLFLFHARQWERRKSQWTWSRLLSKGNIRGPLECLQAAICLDIALGNTPFADCRIL